MLQPKQEERATAKELKELIKKCNIIDDIIKEKKIDTFWIEENDTFNKKVIFFKKKKYE
jgi:hypothetical protein